MCASPAGRIDIVPQGEFHFEVRFFEGESDKRYRSWCLPMTAALLLRLRAGKGLDTAHGLIYRVWDGYGAAGLGLAAPVLVGAPLGAAIGMALGIPTGRLLIWIGFGIVVWSAGVTFGFAMGLAEIGQ